ncbi:MAG: WcaF family extracellular polysaccharide biosynthesis acetyltransferase [Agriterribacter sp.]
MTKVDLSQYDNSWYKPTIKAGILKRSIWYIFNVLFFVNPLNSFSGFKCWLLQLFGAKIGGHVVVKPGVNIKYPWKLKIGDHVWIGEKVWIDNLTEIVIGNNVCISQGAMLLTGNHNYKKKTFDLMVAGITLEDGVWIGAQSIVCPGITAFSHSVLSVGSVATKNMEAFTVYSGNPALPAKQRTIE